MGTQVTFDNATLADAVGKAARIAPRKGAAFDKAAGILFEVNPRLSFVTLKATDLEIAYEQRVSTLEAKGDACMWRIPSSILQGITTNLPMGDGASVTFIDRGDPAAIRIKSGRMVAMVQTYPASEYPFLYTFDTEGMTPAQQLSTKLDQVAWAVDPKSPLMGGVHMDGTRLVGCNQYVLATVPCEIQLDYPITVPLATLSQLLTKATDIKIRAENEKFEITLDSDTKAWTRLLQGNYPKIDRIMRTDFTLSVKIHKQQFLTTLDRLLVMVQNEKSPTLTMKFDGTGMVKVLTFDITISGTGRMQDTIDVDMEFADLFSLSFVPRMLQEAVEKIKGDYFTIDLGHPDPEKAKLQPVRITDDKGFISYISTKKGPDA